MIGNRLRIAIKPAKAGWGGSGRDAGGLTVSGKIGAGAIGAVMVWCHFPKLDEVMDHAVVVGNEFH